MSALALDNPEGWNFRPDCHITLAQAVALTELWGRMKTGEAEQFSGQPRMGNVTFREFAAGVSPMLAGQGAIVVPYCGMVVAIETDGHTHS